MKRVIVQMKVFSQVLDELFRKNKLSQKGYESFERELIEDPETGDLIQGCGGIRKVRLGSAGRGKSGSYRVIYFDYPACQKLYLITLYEKTFKEDLSGKEKKGLKKLVEILKREARNGKNV